MEVVCVENKVLKRTPGSRKRNGKNFRIKRFIILCSSQCTIKAGNIVHTGGNKKDIQNFRLKTSYKNTTREMSKNGGDY
jgi:hypothetical protein